MADVYGITPCLRLTSSEKRAGVNMLSGYGVTAENYNNSHRANIKRNVIELARTWPLYFARLFTVSGAAQVCAPIFVFHFILSFLSKVVRGSIGRRVSLGCSSSAQRSEPLASDQILSAQRHFVLYRSQAYYGVLGWASRPDQFTHAQSSTNFRNGQQILCRSQKGER